VNTPPGRLLGKESTLVMDSEQLDEAMP
jgi:hypothetical protein